VEALRHEMKVPVPDDYVQRLREARLTFLHQRVVHPCTVRRRERTQSPGGRHTSPRDPWHDADLTPPSRRAHGRSCAPPT
jgi:hypothetical protein